MYFHFCVHKLNIKNTSNLVGIYPNRIVKERLEKVWEPAVTKHRAEAVKRQLEAAAAVKEMRDSGDSAEAAGAARAAKMRKENADAEVDALNSLDKKFRDSNGGGDPGKRNID